jgi:hypothetical protein
VEQGGGRKSGEVPPVPCTKTHLAVSFYLNEF